MKNRKKLQGFGINKKPIHDGLFLFFVNYKEPEFAIGFTDDLSNYLENIVSDNFVLLLANPGCSLLSFELCQRVHELVEKNIHEDTDPDLIPEIFLQAFEYISRKMISDEIYFPIAELAEYRFRHESVVVNQHPENKLINTRSSDYF
ncbi:MAG: hypothetical protein WBM44_29100 [Waterburya sp.]